jgi:hypothetical protein
MQHVSGTAELHAWGNLSASDYLEDLRLDGMLKMIFIEWNGGRGLHLSGLR